MDSYKPLAIYETDPDVVAGNVVGRFILVPAKHRPGEIEVAYHVNSVGARIWELLDGNRTVDDIMRTILSEYDVKPFQGWVDLHRFLDKLKRLGVITPVNPTEREGANSLK